MGKQTNSLTNMLSRETAQVLFLFPVHNENNTRRELFCTLSDHTSTMSQANVFQLNASYTDAISSVNFSPRAPTNLLVSSWDQSLRLYDTHAQDGGKELMNIKGVAPVLDACFVGGEGSEIVAGGLDQTVKHYDVQTQKETILGNHKKAVKAVCYNNEVSSIISGSWDCTIQLFDTRSTPASSSSHSMPHKIFSLSTVADKLVVGMAARSVYIYDLRNMSEPLQRRESSLKFMTRTVRCMPDGQGYASSSIEGRVAVEFFDPSRESQSRKYAFKCHRQQEGEVDVVYPVNALAFNPIHGTFASGGGDGVISLWDGAAKRRLKQYARLPASIAALSFSCNGRHLAAASSNGYEDGKEDESLGEHKIFIREIGENEAKPKAKQ